MVASVAGAIPGVGSVAGPVVGASNSVMSNFLTAEHFPSPPADLDPAWQPDGSHVTAANGRYLLEAMVRTGEIDASDLPDSVQNPAGVSNDTVNDDVDDVLTEHLGDGGNFYGDYESRTSDAYNWTRENFGLYHMDQNQIEEFLTSETWGRP